MFSLKPKRSVSKKSKVLSSSLSVEKELANSNRFSVTQNSFRNAPLQAEYLNQLNRIRTHNLLKKNISDQNFFSNESKKTLLFANKNAKQKEEEGEPVEEEEEVEPPVMLTPLQLQFQKISKKIDETGRLKIRNQSSCVFEKIKSQNKNKKFMKLMDKEFMAASRATPQQKTSSQMRLSQPNKNKNVL